MGAETDHRWHDVAASALDWWADAGVDQLIEEQPTRWTAPPVASVPTEAAPPATAPILNDSPLPADPDAFLAWRMGPDTPDAEWPGRVVPPSGPMTAPWLILSDMPEAEDIDAPLTTGPTGRLMTNILNAIGIDRSSAHIATLSVRTPATGQLPSDMLVPLGRIAHHMLSISGATRVLVFGQATSRALFGADEAAARGRLHMLNHDDRKLAVVATHAPRFMVERPRVKADVWRDIQVLMRGLA